MKYRDHDDVLHVRMNDLTHEVMRLLADDSGLSEDRRRAVLDRMVELAGWCQHVLEEHGDG